MSAKETINVQGLNHIHSLNHGLRTRNTYAQCLCLAMLTIHISNSMSGFDLLSLIPNWTLGFSCRY